MAPPLVRRDPATSAIFGRSARAAPYQQQEFGQHQSALPMRVPEPCPDTEAKKPSAEERLSNKEFSEKALLRTRKEWKSGQNMR